MTFAGKTGGVIHTQVAQQNFKTKHYFVIAIILNMYKIEDATIHHKIPEVFYLSDIYYLFA